MRIRAHPDNADFKVCPGSWRCFDDQARAVAEQFDIGLAAGAHAHTHEELLPGLDVAAGNAHNPIAALNACFRGR